MVTFTYALQRDAGDLGWISVSGAQGNKSYVLGWLHGVTSYYPCARYRVVRFRLEDGGDQSVVETAGPNGAPRPARG